MEEKRFKHPSSSLDFEYLLEQGFPKLKLGSSTIHGQGILTEQTISQGDIICPLFGILYNLKKAKIDYPKYGYQISDNISIETVNEPGFFNHSCDPNVFINNDWMFEALRRIPAGEEVVPDYGTVDYFAYSFDCNCQNVGCRQKFDGEIAGQPSYQKQRGKYFSPYLKNKFHLIVPDVFRQRFMIDLSTTKELTKSTVEQYLNGIVTYLRLRSYGGPMVYETGGQGKSINQGYDGFVALVDSGISISTWTNAGLVSVYIHTCKEFSEKSALKYTTDFFEPVETLTKNV